MRHFYILTRAKEITPNSGPGRTPPPATVCRLLFNTVAAAQREASKDYAEKDPGDNVCECCGQKLPAPRLTWRIYGVDDYRSVEANFAGEHYYIAKVKYPGGDL